VSGRLFGTDGVRGVAGEWPLTPAFVERLGFFAGEAFAETDRKKAVLIVRDTRASGEELQRALAAGFRRAGLAVADGGVLPTAAVAILAPKYGFAGGAVLSASHNPAEFNGVKLFNAAGRKLDEALEDRVESGARSDRALPAAGPVAPAPEGAKAGADYIDFLKDSVPGLSLTGLSLVVDCANGAASVVGPALLRSLGAKVAALSASPDGKNINEKCGALHPEALAREVKRSGAALGVAFDGDADRAIFVDETGAVRDGETALLTAARRLKAAGRLKNNLVVSTVMANLGFKRAMDALGIKMEETPVGDKHVAEALERTGGVLGGEPSGHVIFREFLGTGDGLLTALQVLAALRESGRTLSALAALAVKLPQVTLNVPVRERIPLEKMAGFSPALEKARKTLGDAGRVFVRYSGTEPLLRVMVEGPDQAGVESLAKGLAAIARKAAGR
jgi:phosphoglucosamine mutase